jgi:hypothetical protein
MASEPEATPPLPHPPLRPRTFYWDFFGPHAGRTAAHFRSHLDQFLSKHALLGCETGVASERAGHSAAFCVTPPAVEDAIVSNLRPQRAL